MGKRVGHIILFLVAGLIAGLGLNPGQLSAQRPAQAVHDVRATRGNLQDLLSRLDNASTSQAYSAELRERARALAGQVRSRLAEGDFQVGDRIVLQVQGEGALTDTFVVGNGRSILLATIGEVRLNGVLRSELDSYLQEQMARFIRDPVMRSRSYVRITVSGQVLQPGYHLVPPEMPLSEAVMAAGGPTPTADLSAIRVVRGEEPIYTEGSLSSRVGTGETLAGLGLQSGDEVIVPAQPRFTVGEVVRSVGIVTGLVFAFDRIFGRR